MKYLITLMAAVSLTACSTTKTFNETKETNVRTVETTSTGKSLDAFPTLPDFEVRALTRTEVIAATDQCTANGMRPFVEYLSQKTPYGRVMTPVNVHCNPNRKPN